ncbi:MAG: ABC transporter ATP-binding protein [Coriobacteriales bacterium]|jgi:iron complex transport system ATP-binding protein
MKLRAENLDVGHDFRHVVQRDISFEVESGEVCCVLGPNGCGKTTLFDTMLGLLAPRSGHAYLEFDDGTKRDVHQMKPEERAQVLSYVAQHHQPPFPYATRDVIEMGLVDRILAGGTPTEDEEQLVDETMEELGIWELRDEPYTQLSGGELQLTMIARALVQRPRFVFLDEPTAALDYGNEIRVIEQVKRLAERGMGVLMTTHNPDHAFLLDANAVLLGKDFPMVAGSCWDVLTDSAMCAAYKTEVYRVQFERLDGGRMYVCVPDLGD